MFTPKKEVFERFGQTFTIFKHNFFKLFLPIFLYNFVSIVLFGTLFKYFMISKIGDISLKSTNIFSFLNEPFVVMIIIITSILFILYLLLYIPVFIGLIKSINQSVINEKINMFENIKFGFSKLLSSFKTYWYIFAYVALIPAIIFIIGGLLLNLSFYFDNLIFLKSIGVFLMIISLIIFIFFTIYRGIKTRFSLISAVTYDEFDKNNFLNSIKITNNNWWRIVGNILLIGIIVSIISGIISSIFSIFIFSISFDFSIMDEIMNGLNNGNLNINDIINKLINAFISSFSIIGSIISGFINNIINTISSVFIIIFIFIFFQRLESENKNLSEGIVKNNINNYNKTNSNVEL